MGGRRRRPPSFFRCPVSARCAPRTGPSPPWAHAPSAWVHVPRGCGRGRWGAKGFPGAGMTERGAPAPAETKKRTTAPSRTRGRGGRGGRPAPAWPSTSRRGRPRQPLRAGSRPARRQALASEPDATVNQKTPAPPPSLSSTHVRPAAAARGGAGGQAAAGQAGAGPAEGLEEHGEEGRGGRTSTKGRVKAREHTGSSSRIPLERGRRSLSFASTRARAAPTVRPSPIPGTPPTWALTAQD